MNIKELSEKAELDQLSNNIKTYKIPFALRGNLHIVNKSGGPRIIAGYANVAVVDSEEQFIPVETLEKGIICLLQDPHYANLMLVHQNIQIGKIIEKFGEHTTHVDEKGLFIVCEIRKDLQSANEIWEAILNNEINGFSIGCEVLNSHKSCDDTKCITILDEINIFEVSVCSRPVNEESGFIVISKSKFGNVCEECNLRKDENMSEKVEAKVEETKKDKKTEENKAEVSAQTQEKKVEEVKKDIPVPPQVDKMAELERKINALETLIQESKKASEPLSEEDPKIEDMAIFMLDYIIRNPKSSSQDIAKAWIKTKKAPKEKKPVEEPMPEEPMPEEPIPPEEEKPIPLPFSKMNETIDKLSAIVDKLTKLSAEEELKMSIKSRDDQILALQTQIKTLSKPEERKVDEGLPKTIQPVEQHELEKDNPIRIEHGTVYFKE
jgi:HK97 family phage prohead protease